MKTLQQRKNSKKKYATPSLIQRLKKSLQRCKAEVCQIATATECMQCKQHCS